MKRVRLGFAFCLARPGPGPGLGIGDYQVATVDWRLLDADWPTAVHHAEVWSGPTETPSGQC